MIDIQEMYKYSLVLALDSLKDLEANFNSLEVKMFKCPLQHPPVQCQHHHSQHVGAGAPEGHCIVERNAEIFISV